MAESWLVVEQQEIAPAKELFTVLSLCGGAVEIGETEFASRRFLRIRWSSI